MLMARGDWIMALTPLAPLEPIHRPPPWPTASVWPTRPLSLVAYTRVQVLIIYTVSGKKVP